MTPLDMLDAARWSAARARGGMPYLSRALWALQFVAEERIPTLAVGVDFRCYYNPAFVERCAKNKTLAGVVIHEALHNVLRHAPRGKAIAADDQHRWNVCGDFEINGQIEAAHIALERPYVRAEDENASPTASAEEHYRRQQQQQQQQQQQGKGKQGQGAGKPGNGPPSPGSGPCTCSGGSGAGCEPAPGEGEKQDNAPGLSPAEVASVQASVAASVKAHAESKGRGTVPAGLLRWAEQYGEPAPVDWRAMIAAKVRWGLDSRRGFSPSYARPSRRVSPGGIVLPVYRMPQANVALVLDTSGSMGDDDIGAALTCVVDACNVLGRVWAVACDAAATAPVEVRHVDDLRAHLAGGGGTDMVAGIASAAAINPDAIVVVTDGDTPWPATAPDFPVTVVLTRKSHTPVPDWANVVEAPHG